MILVVLLIHFHIHKNLYTGDERVQQRHTEDIPFSTVICLFVQIIKLIKKDLDYKK